MRVPFLRVPTPGHRRPGLEQRRGDPCRYCNHPMAQPTRDHVMPASRGYRFSDFNGRNRAYVCQPCNQAKAHRDIFQFLDWLRVPYGDGTSCRRPDPRVPVVEAFVASFLAEVAWTEEQLRRAVTAGVLYSSPATSSLGELLGPALDRAGNVEAVRRSRGEEPSP